MAADFNTPLSQLPALPYERDGHSNYRMNAREEAQDYYVMRFHKERNHRLSGLPERRGRRWPKSQPWFRHDAQHVYVREQMKAERAVSD